ncbi:hypothetical protein ACLBKS_16340 [Hylemonella sp. W303a]|uniref:hypothetical protein n=1 Tax=Hylemonella sp. W303a TaxID=3389873 RepID=UPI00396B2CA0
MDVDALASPSGTDGGDLRRVLASVRAGDWHAAHDGVQLNSTELGAWLHGLLHVMEGDLEDAEYWYERAGRNFRARGTIDEELEQLAQSLGD